MESENHLKNLEGEEAFQKIKELGEKVNTCFLITSSNSNELDKRPMGTSKIDVDGTIWFTSHKQSNKNKHIDRNSRVDLLYSDPSGGHYMAISGHALISYDKIKIKEFWNPMLKIWFEGPEDQNISLIKVTPDNGFFWDNKSGKMVQMIKMLAGMVTGKELDDSIEGKLDIK